MKKTIYQELMIIDRKAQALAKEVEALQDHHAVLLTDNRAWNLQQLLIGFTDTLESLANDHKPQKNSVS